MDVIFILVPLAILMGAGFAAVFVLGVRSGQFDDLEDPPQRMLKDD